MSNVVIDIAAQFTGNKAFKQAETSTQKLERSVKNLGRSLGLTLSTAAVVAYGKAAVTAFAAEEKSVKSLNLALANTGNAFAALQTEQFIKNLSRAANVIDDELRPAFQTILTATGSLAKAQEGLTLALDISAATGKDLSSVSLALAKGYSGQTTALSRLGVGLDKGLLKSGNMVEIVDVLTEKFKGQAATAAKGYSGQINAIAIASDDAKEIIGKGLLDSMRILGGKDGIQGATDSMVSFAQAISDTIVGVSTLIREIKNIPGMDALGKVLGWSIKNSPIGLLTKLGASQRTTPGQSPAQRAAIDKANLRLQKEKNTLLSIDNMNTKEKLAMTAGEKALAELRKMFDLEGIQIQAALNSATDKETIARLTGLKAINDVDGALAIMALNAIKAAKATDELATGMSAAMQRLMNPTVVAPTGINFSGFTPKTAEESQYIGDVLASNAINRLDALERANNATYLAQAQLMQSQGQNINITLDGQVFQSAVVGAVNQASASGTQLSYTQTATR